MEKFNCLICQREMESTNKILYVDHYCNASDDHHLSWRIKDGNMAKIRIRFSEPTGERLHLKVHYDEKYSEVWTKSKSIYRIRINSIVVPDFMNIEKLKNKIRTLVLFG